MSNWSQVQPSKSQDWRHPRQQSLSFCGQRCQQLLRRWGSQSRSQSKDSFWSSRGGTNPHKWKARNQWQQIWCLLCYRWKIVVFHFGLRFHKLFFYRWKRAVRVTNKRIDHSWRWRMCSWEWCLWRRRQRRRCKTSCVGTFRKLPLFQSGRSMFSARRCEGQ